MDVKKAVEKWEPGTPPRKRTRAEMEGLNSPPYSPAFLVENFGTSEAIKHAAEATGAEEGWSAATVEREKKAALEKQTKKNGKGRGRGRARKTKKAGRRTRRRRGGYTPLPPTNWCDYDSKCSHSDNGKHNWGRVGPGNYVCQNKCGCYFDDR
jgi:hypothetical protein